MTPAVEAALDQLATAIHSQADLEDAARAVLTATGRNLPAPAGEPSEPEAPKNAKRPAKARLVGPWKVVLDTGTGPQAWTSHRSESAAEQMVETLAQSWRPQQVPATVGDWQVVHDPANDLGPGLGADQAQQQAARLVIDPTAASGVTYYRHQVAPIPMTNRHHHLITRHCDGFSEELGRRWSIGGQATVYEANPEWHSASGRQSYVHDLVADALGLHERRDKHPDRSALLDASSDFAEQVLEPLNGEWELPAEMVRDWFLDSGLVDEATR